MASAAEITWHEEFLYYDAYDSFCDKQPGWSIIVDFETPDTGGGAAPERARINFCPFCGKEL